MVEVPGADPVRRAERRTRRGHRRRLSAAPARPVGLDHRGRAGGQRGPARLVPPLPGHRRLPRQPGHGRGVRLAVPPLGPGRPAGRRPLAARHRRVRRLRPARGPGGLAADGLRFRPVRRADRPRRR
ncbi:Exonuclease SbcC [Streptomyces misionensis JCM 4497]